MVERQTISILGKCPPPTAPAGRETGLTIGYVQSGKTLSFTCVAALASDNQFPLVIVITGTSIPLFQQSVRRLRSDLRIDSPANHAWRWQFFENPNLRQNHHNRIRDVLAEWHEPRVPEKQICLIAVMKNHRHLSNLVDLLQQLDLHAVPSLVIDDEADQAGLNTLVSQNDESRTYQRLLALRDALPHHTYLQYTATPQAPLLINIIDVLSPRFVEVLDPGCDYVGAIDFFLRNRQLVRTIPDEEIPSADNHVNGAPQSLREALRLFFVGVAAGILRRTPGNRSMLVHPSRLQDRHANYFSWVSAVRTDWLQLLSNEEDPDRVTLLNDLRASHADLAATYPELPPFGEIEQVLWRTINRTQVWEVNSRLGRTPEVVWQSGYAHILVGGQAMDRGFTVEGLTVTYMPRGKGVGNVDTIQQRARFLGYKRNYLGLCRVFLESEVQRAYALYVNHEENLRQQLRDHSITGRPLTDWRRAFFLDRTLKPTRRCVLDLDYQNVTYGADWFYPRASHFTQRSVEHNLMIIEMLLNSLRFSPTDGHSERTEMQRHGYARVILGDLYESFLTQIQLANPTDSQQFTGLLLQVGEFLDRNPDATASVYMMSWTPEEGQVPRVRTLDDNGEIRTSGAFFQGASVARGDFRQGEVYPGDREIKVASELSAQVHLLNLRKNDHQAEFVAQRVPAVAIWIPGAMAADTLVQDLPA